MSTLIEIETKIKFFILVVVGKFFLIFILIKN